MYGIDMSKPGAQEYYDSVFRLYASWGVDFIKADDMSRPYARNAAEIHAVRRAHRCLRPCDDPVAVAGRDAAHSSGRRRAQRQYVAHQRRFLGHLARRCSSSSSA